MNMGQWFAPGRSISLAIGLGVCAVLLGKGITHEIPLGSMSGRATMTENGRPIAKAMVVVEPLGSFAEQGGRSWVVETDANGEFQISHLPAGDYTVEASAKAHKLEASQVTVPEGKKYVVELEMKPIEPFLDLYASQKVFTPLEKPSIELHGFAPGSKLTVDLYKLDFDKVLQMGSLQDALGPLAGRWNSAPVNPGTMGELAVSNEREIVNRDAEGVFVEGVNLNALSEGLYWVSCKAGTVLKGTYLNITRVALVTKNVGLETTCYVAEIDTGKPVQGAQVGYYDRPPGAPHSEIRLRGELKVLGTTDASGIAQITQPDRAASADTGDGGDEGDGGSGGQKAIVAVYGQSKALTNFWSQSASDKPTRLFTYTDRPIYRPGDTVQFKGIVRQLVDREYRVPPPGQVAIEVRDPDESLLQTMTLPVSAMGTYHGEVAFNRESAPGNYQIVANYAGRKSIHYVSLAAYRKPEFSISVTSARPYYVWGDRARAEVHCEYYFGGPVVGAKVEAYVNRQPSWHYDGEEDDIGAPWLPRPYEEGGEHVATVEATTNERGVAVIDFDTKLTDDPRQAEQDYSYTVSVTAHDASDKYFDGSGEVKVVRGDVDLAIEVDDSIGAAGQPLQAKVVAKRQEDGKPFANLAVAVSSDFEVWTGNTEASLPGPTQQVTTGADGTATFNLAPQRAGSLSLKAEAHNVMARAWTYIEGGPAGSMGPKAPLLTLKLDKRTYEVGGQAKVLIQTDKPGGTALLAVEGERVYAAMAVPLKDKVTIATLPIAAEYAPNAFVAAAYVKDKKFAEASKRLVVELGRRELDVTVASDRKVYHPGDMASYTIETKSSDGKAVPAEVSLGVVDESLYAIQEDTTDVVEGFFPKREDRVTTSYSFPELYLDGGDKAPTQLKVRTDFRDTAYWNPVVQTDAHGRAVVQVKLPDNLTQWRATAVAITTDTSVGMATQNVRARKELMVRLEAPSFIVQQDRQKLIALVSNDSGKSGDVHVQLDAKGAQIEGDLRQVVRVADGGQEKVEWDIVAPSSGEAKFVAKVWIDDKTMDGVQLRLPIQPHGRLMVDRSAGDLKGSATFSLMLYDGADPNTGHLRITLTPSIASGLVQSLDGLIGYPYGCVEQTMSRFLPTVVVSKALKDLGLPPIRRQNEIPAMVQDGFARLRRMQHYDGGWGWWEQDASDLHMTAYVLEGYYYAAKSGFTPSAFSLERALKWAQERLKDKKLLSDREGYIYLAYAMALHGQSQPAADAMANITIGQLPEVECALALMTYSRLGRAYRNQTDEALTLLLSKAQGSGGMRYWNAKEFGEETTARCLLAVATVRPDDPILSQVARYLMMSRRGDMWSSTRDTSYAILGLAQVIKALPMPAPGTVVVAKLGGVEVGRVVVGSQALEQPGLKIDLPVARLRAGPNKVELVSSSTGVLYYSAELTQTVVQRQLGDVITGGDLKVHRAYYRMQPERMEDGTLQLRASPTPVTEISAGDIVKCQLDIKSAKARQFMMVEDPIPAGCRVTERPDLEEGGWTWWYCSLVIRDDRVAFFARTLPSGTSTISYMMRAESPGLSHALPTTVTTMYDPDLRAFSGETALSIER